MHMTQIVNSKKVKVIFKHSNKNHWIPTPPERLISPRIKILPVAVFAVGWSQEERGSQLIDFEDINMIENLRSFKIRSEKNGRVSLLRQLRMLYRNSLLASFSTVTHTSFVYVANSILKNGNTHCLRQLPSTSDILR